MSTRGGKIENTFGRMMTPEREDHIASILKRFHERADAKYRKGQAEHGGNLWDLTKEQLIDNAIEEAVDQVVYLFTLKDKLTRLPRV